MAKKKKILVKDLLELIPENVEVIIQFFAYGIHYCDSKDSGDTCRELKENMHNNCLNAQVGIVTNMNNGVYLTAELVV